jgi:hypothetical protein
MIGHANERGTCKKVPRLERECNTQGRRARDDTARKRQMVTLHGASLLLPLPPPIEWLLPEMLAIARRRFRVLMDRNQDRPGVVVAPTFVRGDVPG